MARWMMGVGVLGLYGYLLAPWTLVAAMSAGRGGGPVDSACRAHLLSAWGQTAVPAIIDAVRAHPPWMGRYAYLPGALGEIGHPAHRALLSAFDQEPRPEQRARLLSALLSAFGDPSRLDVVLGDIRGRRLSFAALRSLPQAVAQALPDAPPLLDEETGGLSDEFLRFWEGRRVTLWLPR